MKTAKTALVLISFQNDFFPNGRMALEKAVEAASKAQEALQLFRVNKLSIVHVQHMSTRPDDKHFLPCTRGVDFYPTLHPLKNEAVIRKHYPNAFRDSMLKNYLKKNDIENLIIAGMMTHLSVDATVRAAYDFGLTCTVLQDACATKNLEFNQSIIPAETVQRAFLAALSPLYADVIQTRELYSMYRSMVAVPA